ncbi:flippase [Oenococcus sp.]|uniref:flippase n=1 Tax=Oenococcus sp. TaxID=1979414 RepID=UPI0039EA9A69
MKVFKNVLYNLSYQILAIALPLVTTPYVSRVIGPQGIGIMNFTNSIISYFLLFGNFGLATYGNREIAYYQNDPKKRSSVFWSVFITRIFFILISFAAFCFWLVYINHERFFLVYIFQSIGLVGAALDVSWFFMGMENFKVTVIRNSVVKIASFAAVLLLVKKSSDVWVYAFIISGSTLIGNLTMFPMLKKYIRFVHFRDLSFARAIIQSFWLFVPTIAISLYVYLNKTLAGIFVSIKAAGFYAQSDSLVKLLLTVSMALGSAMMPHISNLFQQKKMQEVKNHIQKSFQFITLLSCGMCFGLISIASNFVPLFFGPGFDKVADLIIIEAFVIVIISWSNVIGVQYLIPSNQIKSYTISVTIGSILNILLDLIFIPFLGIDGVMLATVLAEGSVTTYQLWSVHPQLDIHGLFFEIWKPFSAAVIMWLGLDLINAYPLQSASNFIIIFLDIVIGVIAYLLLCFGFRYAPIISLYTRFQGLFMSKLGRTTKKD